MTALWAVLVFSISPAAIFIVWLAAVVVLMIAFLIAYKMRPRYTYNDLITLGYSDFEARKLIRVTNGSMNAI